MVALLAKIGGVEDPSAIARQQFCAKTNWIVGLGPYEMCRGDQKDFEVNGWKFGIAVLEVTATEAVFEIADKLLIELRLLKKEKGNVIDDDGNIVRWKARELDFAFLFVVDVTKQRSDMLIAGGRELALAKATWPDGKLWCPKKGMAAPGGTISADETAMDVGPIVSRKSEFVPAFSEALKTFTYEKGKTADLGDLHYKVENHELEAAEDPNQSAGWAVSETSQTIQRDYTKVLKEMEKEDKQK
jgi:inorganic pyrophosphatase/exopolyphosphatase